MWRPSYFGRHSKPHLKDNPTLEIGKWVLVRYGISGVWLTARENNRWRHVDPEPKGKEIHGVIYVLDTYAAADSGGCIDMSESLFARTVQCENGTVSRRTCIAS